MDKHQQFLQEYLMEKAEVYLVSRLVDPRLDFSHPNDFRVFIPDLHLLGIERASHYNYGTNQLALLQQVLEMLVEFKAAAGQENPDFLVTVSQLGDFLDLWRQIPVSFSAGVASERLKEGAQQIMDDRVQVTQLLRGPQLKTLCLLGNHDFDLHNIPDFADCELSYYFPITSQGPSGFSIHGDAFSLFERNMPVGLKNLGVYVFGPAVKPTTEDLGEFRKETLNARGDNEYKNYIQQPQPVNFADIIKFKKGKANVDDYLGKKEKNFNLKKLGDPACNEADLKYLQESVDFAGMVNKEQGYNLRFAVIGHTHHARIAIQEDTDPGGFFALIDCGAWIENCQGSGIQMPSAQMGVIYDNDARIYQLTPKENG